MCGIRDALKQTHGLDAPLNIRRVPIDFMSFLLVLERGRPTAKRVLVGSDKLVPFIQQARHLGYEINILERVKKQKPVKTRGKHTQGNGGYTTSGQSSESEATAAYPSRWVEQAVDEILHLKMMESIIDFKQPSTMVLATGDAAEAEYSAGFLKMVERALENGWMVELVSFNESMSHLYRKSDFRARWGFRFKLIELDRYVEWLLEPNAMSM